jgi:uncharacterized protein YndB with AHSA1/START domain
MEPNFDWSKFTVRINVNASIQDLYNAWATRAGIEHWFLRESLYRNSGGNVLGNDEQASEGDTYTWKWYGYPDSTKEEGNVLAANGNDFFRFTFGKAGICSVSIKKELDETIVELIQDNIPTDEKGMMHYHVGCKTGWTFYFANLKSMMEGGIDLRNRNERLQGMLNS